MHVKRINVDELPPNVRAALELAKEEMGRETQGIAKRFGEREFAFASLGNRLMNIASLAQYSRSGGEISRMLMECVHDLPHLILKCNADPEKVGCCMVEVDAMEARHSNAITAALQAMESMKGESHV